MLFMIVERFRNGDPVPVYRRFRDRGRQLPPGVEYIGSWVGSNLTVCYQIIEAPGRALLDDWMAHWSDLVDFEVIPVVTSAEAADLVRPRL